MNFAKIFLFTAFAATLAGCAHPMVIAPDVSKIVVVAGTQPLKKNVGYYIADEVRNKEVTTPGGGGDKVSYHPYQDMETAYYKMLGNVFSNVTVLKGPNDAEAISKNKINYIIVPSITTDSSSSGALTWPPTDFTFELTCDVSDAAGKAVTSKKVSGKGHAEFAQFKSDFSMTGKLAAEDALVKMQAELLAAPELR